MPKSKQSAPKTSKPKKGGARKFLHVLFIICDVLIIAGLLVSGYSGCISPLKHGGLWGILGLAFPIFLSASVILLILQAIWYRLGAAMTLLGMIACAGPILTFFPLNIGKNDRKPANADAPTFSLVEYNTFNFHDNRPAGTYDNSYSQTVNYIIQKNADIVCLSEGLYMWTSNVTNINAAQMDSLRDLYPHIIYSGDAQVVLCKFPIEPIHINNNDSVFATGADMGIYRINLPGGKLLTLFNVHMQSLLLNSDDITLFREITEMKRENFGMIKSQLLEKISKANVKRARQANRLCGLIRHYGGPNVIVCGDFNDVPGCYAIRALGSIGLRSVYPELGFGPLISYNSDRFYFGIDHILYRGSLRPLSIHRGNNKSSDHYPLYATFEVNE